MSPTEADHYVLGGGELGAAIARLLREAGHAVTLVDRAAEPTDLPSVRVSPTDVAALGAVGVADAETVVVATRSDRRNLLVAQVVRTRFDGPRVVVVVNAVDLFTDAGHEVVCATSAVSAAVAGRV